MTAIDKQQPKTEARSKLREFLIDYGSIIGAVGTIVAGIIAFIPAYYQARYNERALLFVEQDRLLKEYDALKSAIETMNDFSYVVDSACEISTGLDLRPLRCLAADLEKPEKDRQSYNLTKDKDLVFKIISVLNGAIPQQVIEVLDIIEDTEMHFKKEYSDDYASKLNMRIVHAIAQNRIVTDRAITKRLLNQERFAKVENRLRALEDI